MASPHPRSAPVRASVAYAPADEPLRRSFEDHLHRLQAEGWLASWRDWPTTDLAERGEAVEADLNQAELVLLLLSPDLVASAFCSSPALERALQRHHAGECRVVPIMLRPVDWRATPFAHLAALPRDGRAVTDWPEPDRAFDDVVAGIRAALDELQRLAERREHYAAAQHAFEQGAWSEAAQYLQAVLEQRATAPSGGDASAVRQDGGLYVDENVQFTVYRPRAIQPARWYPLLAFAHLAERAEDADEDEPDPLEEVRRQASQVLGDAAASYQDVTQDSRVAIPRRGELSFVPELPGIEFNPPRRSFLWLESVHREEFRLRAAPELDGQTVRGHLVVFLGNLVVGDVAMSIRVDSRPAPARLAAQHTRPYRKIFASYAHHDRAIVEEVEHYARVTGDRYLRDVVDLRAGEAWDERLLQLIDAADIFQLFWSWNALRSPFVRREWEHAMALGRPFFIRPVYWEDPFPRAPEHDLPPEALARLHFCRIYPALPLAPPPPATVAPSGANQPASASGPLGAPSEAVRRDPGPSYAAAPPPLPSAAPPSARARPGLAALALLALVVVLGVLILVAPAGPLRIVLAVICLAALGGAVLLATQRQR